MDDIEDTLAAFAARAGLLTREEQMDLVWGWYWCEVERQDLGVPRRPAGPDSVRQRAREVVEPVAHALVMPDVREALETTARGILTRASLSVLDYDTATLPFRCLTGLVLHPEDPEPETSDPMIAWQTARLVEQGWDRDAAIIAVALGGYGVASTRDAYEGDL